MTFVSCLCGYVKWVCGEDVIASIFYIETNDGSTQRDLFPRWIPVRVATSQEIRKMEECYQRIEERIEEAKRLPAPPPNLESQMKQRRYVGVEHIGILHDHFRQRLIQQGLSSSLLTFRKAYNILSELSEGQAITLVHPSYPLDEESGSSGSWESNGPSGTERKEIDMNCDKVIAVHVYMLREIEGFVEEFKSSPGIYFDFQTSRLSTGVAMMVKIEDNFDGVNQEKLNSAVALQRNALERRRDFKAITKKIAKLLAEFDEP